MAKHWYDNISIGLVDDIAFINEISTETVGMTIIVLLGGRGRGGEAAPSSPSRNAQNKSSC